MALRRFYQADRHTAKKAAKCPEPLCPTSMLPPLGRCECHLLRGRYPSVTPPSSLLRAHVPLPLGSLLLRHLASFEESWQVVRSPCCPPGASRRYLSKSFLGCWIPYPGGTPCALTCFFHDVIGLPQTEMGRLPAYAPRITTSRGGRFSRLQIFLYVPASKFARPQIVPTAANTAAGQPGLLHPGLSCFVTSTRTGYANRPNTGN